MTEISFSRKEQASIRSLTQSINDVERVAVRLEKAITDAQNELDGQTIDLLAIGREPNPFSRYQGAVLPMLQRNEMLKRFIDAMQGIPAEIRKEQDEHRSRIDEITRAAKERNETLAMLEEQLVIDGDLPAEQRKLLLELKTLQAA